ncbi:mitochondrial amidoxime reducing component 2-like [Zingiber officinale]|uniref:mitochondrial amidoxime reducing component 2-like n=1 Tax=Zingiber officinale TaxID=94328 RepID=UPI001C4D9C47|nr:mitochondrial amidoxime reducing component 2-like [Zingiber officinale]
MEKASSVLAALFGSREPAEAAATVTSIFVYPIKSCRGISVPQACVTSTGLQWDRQWLVVNSKGRAYTQRVEPKLALVDIELPMDAFKDNWEPTDLSYMVIKAPDMEALRIPLNKKCAAVDDISVWEWSGSALNEGNEAFEWFTKYLGKPSRLVRFNTELEIRAVDPNYAQGYKTLFTDGFPFLLASQGSLDGLNELLDEPLPINRFRPNILVDGCDPFSEDLWKELKINKLNFHGVKLCARCKIPTINQENGVTGNEPTSTLMKFRSDHALKLKKTQGKMFFGQNLVCKESLLPPRGSKTIVVGDPVFVLQKYSSNVDAPI